MRRPTRVLALAGDASGAVADLGVLIPIAAALIVKNGLDAGTVLVGAGALYCAAGLFFRVPVPVQPIKAAAAIAIARELSPPTIAAAGFLLGFILVALSVTGLAGHVSRFFTKPVVRGLQVGVGLLLVQSALRLPKPSFSTVTWVGVVIAAVLVALAARGRRWPVALVLVGGGVLWSLAGGGRSVALQPTLWEPRLFTEVFRPSVLWTAFTVLVIPQIPLTFGNAVVAVTDLEHRFFGPRAARVNPMRVALSCGTANMVLGSLGGMPLCHGSGGLTAHYRSGARSYRMNLLIGIPLVILGLGFGATAFSVLALIPLAVLVGLLAFTGVMHAWLVSDLRGYELAIALAMGVVGVWTSNLAVSLALGLVLVWFPRLVTATKRHRARLDAKG